MSFYNNNKNKDSSTAGTSNDNDKSFDWLGFSQNRPGCAMSPYLHQATAILHSMDQSLRCSLCKNIYEVPVSIQPCHHAFCNGCIQTYFARACESKEQERQGESPSNKETAIMKRCPICLTPVDDSLDMCKSIVLNRSFEETARHYKTLAPLLKQALLHQQHFAGGLAAATTSAAATGSSHKWVSAKRKGSGGSGGFIIPQKSHKFAAAGGGGCKYYNEQEEDEEVAAENSNKKGKAKKKMPCVFRNREPIIVQLEDGQHLDITQRHERAPPDVLVPPTSRQAFYWNFFHVGTRYAEVMNENTGEKEIIQKEIAFCNLCCKETDVTSRQYNNLKNHLEASMHSKIYNIARQQFDPLWKSEDEMAAAPSSSSKRAKCENDSANTPQLGGLFQGL